MYKNIFSLEKKVALIIGGSGLLGREIVKAMKDSGAEVYVADVESANVRSVVKELAAAFVPVNIYKEQSVKDTFSAVLKKAGKIDVVVNTAYPRTSDWGAKLEQVKFASWNKNIEMHLGGYYLCSKYAAGVMKKQKSGSIINISSIYGVVAPQFDIYDNTSMTMPVAYSAIKGGIAAFSKYFATYFGKYNIRVNVISPGGIFDNQPKSFVERYKKKTPLHRMAIPSDIVGSVVFLASDASRYITGQNIIVDGGWTVW